MKILIVGGGVGGPALARFLKDSAKITLVDKAPAWGNIGYAITLWGNGDRILKKLGIESAVFKDGYTIPWTGTENKKGKLIEFFSLDVFRARGSVSTVTRTALQQALVKDLENFVDIKLNTTVSNISQDKDGATVTFSDGSNDKFDLVVGADGVHSQVREMIFGKNFLKYYGWKVYAFWTPKEFVPPKGAIDFLSKGKICFIYPMQDRAVIMLCIVNKEQTFSQEEITKDFLRKSFSDFEDLVGHMIDSIKDGERIFHDNMAYVKMNEWYKGRVVLIGDAQHASSPLAGMGSSMALEDAYVLSEELKATDMEDVPTALSKFSERRTMRLKKFHKASGRLEYWIMVKSPFVSFFRDLILKIIPSSFFTKPMEKLLSEEI